VKYRSRYIQDALTELREQIKYYNSVKPGLGAVFRKRVKIARDSIVEMPEAWKKYPGWEELPIVRMRSVDRFPFDIIYFLDGDQVIIVAVANEARRPQYWASRITNKMRMKAANEPKKKVPPNL